MPHLLGGKVFSVLQGLTLGESWLTADLIGNAELGGTVPMWQWIGDDSAITFSY